MKEYALFNSISDRGFYKPFRCIASFEDNTEERGRSELPVETIVKINKTIVSLFEIRKNRKIKEIGNWEYVTLLWKSEVVVVNNQGEVHTEFYFVKLREKQRGIFEWIKSLFVETR